MLKMSFFNGTLNREEAKKIITDSEKEIRYTYGLSYRNPTTYKKLINQEEAFKIIDEESLLDITEEDDYFHINTYSSNDMW